MHLKSGLTAIVTGAIVLATATNADAQLIKQNDNAALRYWRAFSLMSEADTETTKELASQDGDGWLQNEEHVKWLEGRASAIELLTDASRMTESDFGIDYDKGIEALITHLGPMRSSARLLILRAEADLHEGNTADAIEHAAAALRMAEHISDEGILISSLVSVSIFSTASEFIHRAHKDGEFQHEDLTPIRDALARFDRNDPFGAERAVEAEAEIFGGWIHRKLADADANERAELLVSLTGDPSDHPTERTRRLIESVDTLDKLDAQMSSYKLYCVQALAIWNDEDASEQLRELGEGISKGLFGNVAMYLAPAMNKVHSRDMEARLGYELISEIVGG